MSVADLQTALQQNPQAKRAIVSGQLLLDLNSAGLLSAQSKSVRAPNDPKYGPIINAWLVSIGINPNATITVPYTVMSGMNVLVEEDVLHGMLLVPTGPNSFVLR